MGLRHMACFLMNTIQSTHSRKLRKKKTDRQPHTIIIIITAPKEACKKKTDIDTTIDNNLKEKRAFHFIPSVCLVQSAVMMMARGVASHTDFVSDSPLASRVDGI